MSTLIEQVESGAKRVAGFITGRGMTATAVALASPFLETPQLPIVGLTVGLPVTAAMSTMAHYEREDKILKNFREEIAASFGIDAQEVTHDHLRSLAYGNTKLGIEPQPFFHEILERNDKNRWIDIGANLSAAAVGIGFVALKGGTILTAISEFAGASTIGLLAANPAVVGFIGLSLAAGAIVHAMDYVCSSLVKTAFAERDITAYEMLEHFAKQKERGIALSQDQVMSVFTKIDKSLHHEIITDYGAPYRVLPEATRREVLDKYRDALHINDITDKINAGTVKINELAFLGAGAPSGVPERTPEQVAAMQAESERGLGEKLQQFRSEWREHRKIGASRSPLQNNAFSTITHATPAAVSTPTHVAKINDLPYETGFLAEHPPVSTPIVNHMIEVTAPSTALQSGDTAQYVSTIQFSPETSRTVH
jgi:hypothetical protein